MPDSQKQDKVPAGPLFEILDGRTGGKAQFARKIGVSLPQLANWRSRGIPWAKLIDVTQELDCSVEDYLTKAGILKAKKPSGVPTNRHLEHISDYERTLIQHARILDSLQDEKGRDALMRYAEERVALAKAERGGAEVIALAQRRFRKKR